MKDFISGCAYSLLILPPMKRGLSSKPSHLLRTSILGTWYELEIQEDMKNPQLRRCHYRQYGPLRASFYSTNNLLYILPVLFAVRRPGPRAGHVPTAIIFTSPTSLSPFAHCITNLETHLIKSIFGCELAERFQLLA